MNSTGLIYSVVTLVFIFITSVASAAEKVGTVVVVQGVVYATAPDQTKRELARGADIYLKDKITTDENSKIQIKLLDNTIFSMRTNSEIEVSTYIYNKTKTQNETSVVNLVKGGFRNITGLIAKKNPANYKINTPVALIGVRGTDYSAVLSTKDELYVSIWKGQIALRNNAGLLVIGTSSQFKHAMISSQNALPKGLITAPAIIMECP